MELAVLECLENPHSLIIGYNGRNVVTTLVLSILNGSSSFSQIWRTTLKEFELFGYCKSGTSWMRNLDWSTLDKGKSWIEVWFYLKVTVSFNNTTLVKTVMIQNSKRQQNSVCLLFNINIDTNSVNPDLTAPTGAVWSASTLFVKEASKLFSKQQKHTKFRDRHLKG